MVGMQYRQSVHGVMVLVLGYVTLMVHWVVGQNSL